LASISGKDIYDHNGVKIACVKKNVIVTPDGSKIALIMGNDILDARHRKIGDIVEINRFIDGSIGTEYLAALWLLFAGTKVG